MSESLKVVTRPRSNVTTIAGNFILCASYVVTRPRSNVTTMLEHEARLNGFCCNSS